MPKFKIKSPLEHNGELYPIGSTIDLDEKTAAPLMGHTLVLPGEELTAKDVAQGIAAVEGEAERLADLGKELEAREKALKAEEDKLAAAQADLAAAQKKK